MRRKAAGTLRVRAKGRAAHSGSAPDRGRNALLALAAAAQAVASCHDPSGADHLTAVPTVMHAGDAFNVVPGAGELFSDLRADTSRLRPRDRRDPSRGRRRDAAPGDGPPVARDGLERGDRAAARARLGGARPAVPAMHRGGASDASHFAAAIPVTVDGLGPRGGAAHNPEDTSSRSRWPRARRSRSRWRRPRSARDGDRLELARAQERDQLALRPRSDRSDRALLEVSARASQVIDDCVKDGSWPTTSTRARVVTAEQLEASSRSKPLPSTSSTSGSVLSASAASFAVSTPRTFGLV